MLTLSSDNKEKLIALAKQHCQSYLELHQELEALDSELPNDGYFVGMGLDIEHGPEDERLENHFASTKAEVRELIDPITSLLTREKKTVYSLTERHIYAFCVSPDQDTMEKLNSQLRLALDIIAPPKPLAPAQKSIPHILSKSMFQPTKQQKHIEEIREEETLEENTSHNYSQIRS